MKIAICIIMLLAGCIIMTFTQLISSYFCKRESNSSCKKISGCDECGEHIKGVHLIPIAGYIISRGRCDKCNGRLTNISVTCQILAGICFVLTYLKTGICLELFIYCLLTLVLIIITYVDFKTYIIPPELNYFIFALGIFVVVTDIDNWLLHIIGFFAMSVPVYLLILATNGKAMGGGDCKLVATVGLVIGWKLIILGFFLGCIFGSVIHIIRIKVSNEDHRLALGPYLALGIFISMLYGNDMINWYLSLM